MQINERASAIVLFADQPALSYINHASGDRDRAVTSFAGDAVRPHHHQIGSGALGDFDHRSAREYGSGRQALLLKGDVALVGSDRDQPGLVEQIGQRRGKALTQLYSARPDRFSNGIVTIVSVDAARTASDDARMRMEDSIARLVILKIKRAASSVPQR